MPFQVGSGQRASVRKGDGGSHTRSYVSPGTSGVAPANRPTNPAAILYNSVTGTTSAWAVPGALIVAGRENYDDPVFHTLAAGGATVLIYLHMSLMNTVGRYHDMLYNSSTFGGTVPGWPGGPWVIDQYGNLADYRVGSLLNSKLPGLMALMVSENPHISGFFFDGLGTRATPGDGGFDWDTFPDKEDYRAAAIAQCQIARTFCDANDMFCLANSNFQAGDIASALGGGYPDRMQHGCSLVDGAFIEEHPTIDAFYTNYCNSTQWGSATPRNKAYMWASNVGNSSARATWASSNLVAFSSDDDYTTGLVTPWGSFTNFGMPHR